MIRLLHTHDHGWYISIFNKNHNHRLSPSCDEKRQWNCHNEIDPLDLDFVKNLRQNNISVGKVYNILGSAGGNNGSVPFRKQALRNLCSKISQEAMEDDLPKTVTLLQEMRTRDTGIDIDTEGRVKTMIWSTGRNKADYECFVDAITFDTTYKTNLYNMPFGLFVGVNNHYQSVIFAGVLMREGTTTSFEWVFRSFVSIMKTKYPSTILTDQCQAMRAAIQSTLPDTRHRWRKWHVLRNAKEKLGHIYS